MKTGLAEAGSELDQAFDTLTATIVAGLGRLKRQRSLSVSQSGDDFILTDPVSHQDTRVSLLDAGQRQAFAGLDIDVLLDPAIILFASLDVPRRAESFVPGIVQSQIDRLTPWSARDCIYSWSKPVALNAEVMKVTVAAMPRVRAKAVRDALAILKPARLRLLVEAPGTERENQICLREESLGAMAGQPALKRTIKLAYAGVAALALVGFSADFIIGGSLQTSLDDTLAEIASRREKIAHIEPGARSVELAFAAEKSRLRSRVEVIDELAAVVPDHSYLTGLEFRREKLALSGLTRDMPDLLRAIETSRFFAGVVLSGPATRNADLGADEFKLETSVKAPEAKP